MPRKIFVAGEILTAADVNTNLMDQSVMVFDDATARTTAIPTPVEGMVTYLKDEDEVTVFDGSAFKAVGPGKILQVVSVTKTNIFSAALASGANTNVDGLSITHAVSRAENKVLLLAQIGHFGNSQANREAGFSFAEDGTLLNIGDAGGTFRVGAGRDFGAVTGQEGMGGSHPLTFLHTPGSGSKTYTVRVTNLNDSSSTVFVNRSSGSSSRASSTLTLMEVTG